MNRHASAAAAVMAAMLIASAPSQDSKPAAASRPARDREKTERVFEPNQYDRDTLALFPLVRARLITDWVFSERPKPVRAPSVAEMKDSVTQGKDSFFFDNDVASVRGQVEKIGIRDPSGARVLPLGRIVWEKPGPYLKATQNPKVAVLAILVATPSMPRGKITGYTVRGEFQDRDGRRLAVVDRKSCFGYPSNGVFLIVMPAGDHLKDAPDHCGFRFKLTGVQALTK